MANAPAEVIDVAVAVIACACPSGRVTAVDAARELDRMGLLRDSPQRRGLPLRNHLRAGRISNAHQEGVFWWIDQDPAVCEAIEDRGGVTKPLGDPWSELVSAIDALRRSSERLERQTAARGGDLAHTSGWHANSGRRVDQAIAMVGGASGVGRLASARRSAARAASVSPRGDDWSPAEDAAIVADYLEMLEAERAGRRYNKAAHRRALVPKLDGRTEGAIEFKHRNISASMERLGLPTIKGYVPAANIQGALIDEITRQTRGGETLREAEADLAPPTPARPLRLVDRPEHKERRRRQRSGGALRTPDYGAIAEEQRHLGRTGEGLVVEYEQARLREAGQAKLARRVEWIAKDLGDGAGYDIASFEVDGSELHIEVKTTRGGASTPFYLSVGEKEFADEHPSSARIYRVYDLDGDPKFFVVLPPYEEELTIEPIVYRAWP